MHFLCWNFAQIKNMKPPSSNNQPSDDRRVCCSLDWINGCNMVSLPSEYFSCSLSQEMRFSFLAQIILYINNWLCSTRPPPTITRNFDLEKRVWASSGGKSPSKHFTQNVDEDDSEGKFSSWWRQTALSTVTIFRPQFFFCGGGLWEPS